MEYDSLVEKKAQESSEAIRQRVCEVRNLQRMRYGGTKVNARLDSRETEEFCRLGEPENEVMKQAFAAFGFTARTYHKVLKVARTIADLDGSQEILKQHLCEAIGYRTRIRSTGNDRRNERMKYEYWFAGIRNIPDRTK